MTNNKPMSDFTVTQQPFNEISRLPNNTQYNYSWPIPFFWKNYRTYHIDHTTKLKWMIPDYYHCPSHSASKSALSPKREPTNFALHWDLGNTDSKTFMRVEYDDVAYARLMKQLKTRRDKDFGIDDKVILIADQLAFAKHNEELGKPFSFKKTLDLISTIIPGNDSYAIFKITQGVIDRMEKYFMDGPDYPLFKKGMQEWLTENYKKLGYTVSDIWDPE
ncbi:unnamed protein product [Anisakis simplex]|uniref:Uncharacterized protein n=1 Tax=Anisakis simplex TaxID=6269 RepID=A0A3P6NDU6_ANISI|nr:unnamed protein product [Anisakis simplex]